MKKRHFLTAAALGGASLATLAQTASERASSPVLLTVTGAIGKVNRGPIDPVLDQMMAKQKISFEKAHGFDFGELAALPAVTIKPTLEYDNKAHTLKGPLLIDVLSAAGAAPADSVKLLMRAVDGYSPNITMADVRKYRFIVATHLDGKSMPLGGLGPLWAVYDADRFPDMAAKKVT
ncbi:MAG: hypothetical protein ACI83N_000497, partial [Hydrogenophaga sp.]